jgi:hypothetical protein
VKAARIDGGISVALAVRFRPSAHPATVTGIDTREIHRRPVLNGLINEHARAA